MAYWIFRILCFWCDEKFEPVHRCKGKIPKLYHLEVEEQEEGEEECQEDEQVRMKES